MRAAIFNGPGDIGVEERPRPEIEAPTDAIVRVTHTAICGSDLWFYRGDSDRDEGSPVGHEPMGIVEEVGNEVTSVAPGDRVLAPFAISCGECEFCRKGLHTSCENGDSWGATTAAGRASTFDRLTPTAPSFESPIGLPTTRRRSGHCSR